MRELILEDLAEIFGEVIDLSGVELHEQVVLGEDLPIESREMLRVLSRIEARYRLRFEPKDLLRMKTLGDLLDVVRRHVRIG